MENKQTAVEWIYDEIKHIIPNGFLNKFEQAKQMEKKQIEKAYDNGGDHYTETGKAIWGNDYYNETYGK